MLAFDYITWDFTTYRDVLYYVIQRWYIWRLIITYHNHTIYYDMEQFYDALCYNVGQAEDQGYGGEGQGHKEGGS